MYLTLLLISIVVLLAAILYKSNTGIEKVLDVPKSNAFKNFTSKLFYSYIRKIQLLMDKAYLNINVERFLIVSTAIIICFSILLSAILYTNFADKISSILKTKESKYSMSLDDKDNSDIEEEAYYFNKVFSRMKAKDVYSVNAPEKIDTILRENAEKSNYIILKYREKIHTKLLEYYNTKSKQLITLVIVISLIPAMCYFIPIFILNIYSATRSDKYSQELYLLTRTIYLIGSLPNKRLRDVVKAMSEVAIYLKKDLIELYDDIVRLSTDDSEIPLLNFQKRYKNKDFIRLVGILRFYQHNKERALRSMQRRKESDREHWKLRELRKLERKTVVITSLVLFSLVFGIYISLKPLVNITMEGFK